MRTRKLVQGYLLEAGRLVERDVFPISSSIQFVRTIESTGWEEYIYRSTVALRNEDQPSFGGQFEYGLICRRSGKRLLLVADANVIVDTCIKQELANGGIRLRRVAMAIDPLVKHLTRTPERYVMTRVDALTDAAFGENLRSVSFYGTDIGATSFFRDHVSVIQCYSCGLRDAGSRNEILRLSNRGMVAFQYAGPSRLIAVERVLAFVRRMTDSKFSETSNHNPIVQDDL
jgi:hypothetical protein